MRKVKWNSRRREMGRTVGLLESAGEAKEERDGGILAGFWCGGRR